MYDFVEIDFPEADIKPSQLISMSFHQERYKHEFATFVFRDWNQDYNNIRPGTPVSFTLNGGSTSRDVNGYIHHVKPNITPGKHYTEINVIGASYQLKQPSQQVYKDVTADQVVTQIAKRNGFAYKAVPHPRKYKQISQAGLTDLQMLVKVAKQSGYSLLLQNAEIHFQPVTKLHDQEKANAPRFIMRTHTQPEGSTLYSFKPLLGESLDIEGEKKSATAVAGVDAYTAEIIQVTNQTRSKPTKQRFEPEYFDGFATGIVANDHDVAKNEAKSFDERTKFAYHAHAEVLGDAGLYPDMPIYLEGVGFDYEGYWVVLKTEHKVVQTSHQQLMYTTLLTLGTDSLGESNKTNATDGNLLQPNPVAKRTIVPGVRQTNKKAQTKLKPGVRNPAKSKTPIGFGKVGNRARPKTANKVIVASKWHSSSGNLNKVTKEVHRSPAVVQRLRAKNVI